MSTLHFVLASERSSATNESIGRATMFLTTVSMSLVALGFLSAATKMGDDFYLFAVVLLAALVPLGMISFNRVAQIGIQDIRLSYTIGRVHRFYATAVPGIERWMGLDPDDHRTRHAVLSGAGSRFQDFFTAASMVGAVNSAIIGTLAGVIVGHYLRAATPMAVGAGLLFAIASFWLHLRQQARLFAVLPPLEESNL